MMQKRNLVYSTLFLLCFTLPIPGMNLLMRPYDTLLRPEMYLDRCYELAFWAETGVRPGQGYNSDSERVNVLRIWNPDQDALAMLDGFSDTSTITQLRNALNATDDDVRGHLILDGKLKLDFGGVIVGRWYSLSHAWLTAYLPFYRESD